MEGPLIPYKTGQEMLKDGILALLPFGAPQPVRRKLPELRHDESFNWATARASGFRKIGSHLSWLY